MSITIVFIFKMYYEFGIVINDLTERLIIHSFGKGDTLIYIMFYLLVWSLFKSELK